MRNNLSKYIVGLQIFLLLLWFITSDSLFVVIGEILLIFFIIVDKLGKGIVLRETIALHTSLVILLIPKIGYLFYSDQNTLAKVWVKSMPIPEMEYFSFAIPAALLFNLTLIWPISNYLKTDEGDVFLNKFDRIIYQLNNSYFNAQILIILGTFIYLIMDFLPVTFQYVGFLSFLIAFVGFLMLYFKPNAKHRKATLFYFVIFLAYVTLQGGMFTIVVYMGMTIFSFLFLKHKMGMLKKIALFTLAVFAILTIQNVKGIFRSSVSSDSNSAILFGNLVANELNQSQSFFSADKFFFFYVRSNQGFYVAKVMDYIPKRKEYDDGEYLFKALASSFIPRLFWPDKPKAGGRYTTKYFTGNDLVGNTSMNVSPFGEAYGSFGRTGGIIYLFLLALFIRVTYTKVFSMSWKYPYLIFWIPVIFFQVTYSIETDSLQIFNSVIKSVIFMIIIYNLYPELFGKTASPPTLNILPR